MSYLNERIRFTETYVQIQKILDGTAIGPNDRGALSPREAIDLICEALHAADLTPDEFLRIGYCRLKNRDFDRIDAFFFGYVKPNTAFYGSASRKVRPRDFLRIRTRMQRIQLAYAARVEYYGRLAVASQSVDHACKYAAARAQHERMLRLYGLTYGVYRDYPRD